MLANTTRFEHYKDSAQYMNDMQVLFTSHALCFACLRSCLQRRPPRYARDPRAGPLLPDMLLEDIRVFFAFPRFWSPDRRNVG